MLAQESAAEMLAALEAEHQALWALIAASDALPLAARPANGDRSIVENLRHLLFAEQAHLGRLRADSPDWHPFGLAPDGLQKRLPLVGSRPTEDAGEVLAAWHDIHASLPPQLEADSEALRKALDKNLRHLRNHIKLIQRLLRQQRKATA